MAEEKKETVTNDQLQLELKALRSDVRLWILAAVGLNAFLANASLPSTITVPAVFAAIFAPVLKSLIAMVGRY